MKHDIIPMDETGRIVIPKTTRLSLKLRGGTRFELKVSGSDIVLKPVGTKSNLIRKHGFLVWVTTDSLSIEDIESGIRLGQHERDRRNIGFDE